MPKYGNSVDFSKWPVINFVNQVLASAPASPVIGQAYFDSVLGYERVWDGSSWDQASGGTLTGLSVVMANGFAGTVATPTTTPAITLTTTITGILKGNGTAISAAAAGTDYLAPTGNGSGLTGLTVGQVSGAAPLASPTFTGTPAAPTATGGTNTTQLATTAFVASAIASLIATAPSTLDTLNEIAVALGNDPNFATTITTSIGTKLAKASNLSDLVSASTARTNLGLGTAAVQNVGAFAQVANNLSDVASATTSRQNLAATGVYSAAGTGTGATFTITRATHGLGTAGATYLDIIPMVWDKSGNPATLIQPDVAINTTTGDVTWTWGGSQTLSNFRFVLIGK